MNNSDIANNQSITSAPKHDIKPSALTQSQLIGIIIAATVIGLAFIVLVGFVCYQKYRLRISKKHAHSLTSNNPCYVSGPINDFESNISHAHCNMSVTTDFYDIDDLNSLDNDSFLNSLENAIFVGYLNYNRPNYSVDHGLSRMSSESTVGSSQPVFRNVDQQNPKRPNNHIAGSTSHQSKHSTGPSNARNSIHMRIKKSKRSVSNIDHHTDHGRPRNKSESGGCEITRSTSNLISSSKMCLTASSDSVCDSSRGSNQIAETACQYKLDEQIPKDKNVDNKTESSNDSRTSVNSSSAMMSGYLENNGPLQTLPDLIHSSLPKSAKHHKRVASAYSNMVSRDDYVFSSTTRSGQILDPLRAGQTFHFTNESPVDLPTQSRHERHLSHNFGISNVGVFDYNVSS